MALQFSHLHSHTNYSLLDGAANIASLIQQNKLLGMEALAITDHGNMFGIPQFVNAAQKEGIKPIIGCECYLAHDMHDRKDKRRFHQILLAKNEKGYQNLMKLCSLGFTEGYYYKPRIDKKTIKKHAEGLIATTCCLAAEVPRAILEQGEEAAEKIFLSWLEIFGEDYYIELQRHGIPEQETCNQILLKWGKKHQVKIIATNDVHYIKKEDSLAQDIMLCLQTGKNFDDPNRMRFTGDQFYLKSPQEMLKVFSDHPAAIDNTQEIVDKIDTPTLQRELLMPMFKVPKEFSSQNDYLTSLTFSSAKARYGEISAQLEERLRYELKIITSMGFGGYFLIVQDMINTARKLGVCVGPGRGSVAGSTVAYALNITDVEPLRYGLLFERFLNPERISMPDIDVDFDDEGRQKVIDYLVQKYGYQQVAQIITFNGMGAKSAIRDVARVLGLPLPKADTLAKLIPDKLGTTLNQAIAEVPELKAHLSNADSLEGKVLAIGKTLEGSPRHSSIHAAGIIIAPQPLIDLIPIKTDKKSDLLVTQYDGSVVEKVGMLKMDLLGLRTLSIIRDALQLIKKAHGKEIDITKLPLDDKKTFELYQQGNTIGIFQFESEGMRAYLKQLHPTQITHLIAMNALYRPGPMKNIPSYMARMHGKEPIDYMHPALKETLENTYGIPVYQEQIMKIARIMAGYSLGEADLLRRAMGKKKREEMEQHEARFIKGAKEKHDVEEKKAKEIFATMRSFAEYGFPMAHAVAYTLLSYQTAYLKANYPTAFMASVLIHNQRNMDKITFFIDECKRLDIEVKGPDINESQMQFSNHANHTIRFGLAAIKGIGEKAVEGIIAEREKNGAFKDLNDLVYRIISTNKGKGASKKVLETLGLSGAFHSLATYHRKQYTYEEDKGGTFIEQLIKYEQRRYKAESSIQQSLFATEPTMQYGKPPQPPICAPYEKIEKLKIEKELVGFYISDHPLRDFDLTIKHFCNAHTQSIPECKHKKEVCLAGMVTSVSHRQNSKGSYFGIVTIEDYQGTLDMMFFGETYSKYRYLLEKDQFIFLKGRVQPRYGRADQLDFRPMQVEPLETILERHTQKVILSIPVGEVTEPFVDNLKKLLKQYAGKSKLQLNLFDPEANIVVNTFARQYSVTPSQKFFSALDDQKIRYQLKAHH